MDPVFVVMSLPLGLAGERVKCGAVVVAKISAGKAASLPIGGGFLLIAPAMRRNSRQCGCVPACSQDFFAVNHGFDVYLLCGVVEVFPQRLLGAQ
jgi:hypothetical protein